VSYAVNLKPQRSGGRYVLGSIRLRSERKRRIGRVVVRKAPCIAWGAPCVNRKEKREKKDKDCFTLRCVVGEKKKTSEGQREDRGTGEKRVRNLRDLAAPVKWGKRGGRSRNLTISVTKPASRTKRSGQIVRVVSAVKRQGRVDTRLL